MASTSTLTRSSLRRTIDASGWPVQAGVVILGSSLLWASAKVQVPFWPVPMTMQTYVVLAMGALMGWRLGAATMAAYLAEGALGLPVFAGTPAHGIGLAYIAGPTGGYLVGYLVAVTLVGLLARNRRTHSLVGTTAMLLIGELIILGLGCCWLAVGLGWQKALAFGFGPFLVGDAMKLGLAVITVAYAKRLMARYEER